MTNINKTKFLLLLSLAAIIFIGSCKKSASIVGTWTETSERDQEKRIGVTVLDTTYQVASSTLVITFKSDNTYTSLSATSGSDAGVYTNTGGKLTLVSNLNNSELLLNVQTLSSNTLAVQNVDTLSTAPLDVYYTTLTFSH